MTPSTCTPCTWYSVQSVQLEIPEKGSRLTEPSVEPLNAFMNFFSNFLELKQTNVFYFFQEK